MAMTSAEVQAKLDKLEINMGRFDQIVNADNTTDVTVDSGTVPSVSKFFNDIASDIEEITDQLTNPPSGTLSQLTGLNSDGEITKQSVTAFATASQGSKADTALQPAYNYISRAGNYIGVGQQADFDGFGKGGIYLGGGDQNRGTGSYISLDGLRNWITFQSAKVYNPTELIVYGSSAQGYAKTVPSTGNISWLYGSSFTTDWVGKTLYFLRKKFKVSSVTSSTVLTVTELDGSPVTFPSLEEIEAFNFNYTTGEGVCNIVGDRLIWVSGDPFVPTFFRDFHVIVNGTERTILNFISPKEYQLSTSPGNISNVAFSWYGDVFDQLSTIRVQAIQGAQEENVNIYSVAGQAFYGRYYAFRAGGAGGYSQYRPIFMGSGEYGAYLPRDQVGLYPNGGPGNAYGNGYVSLGGVQGLEALRVYNPVDMNPLRNRLEILATPSGTRTSIRALGFDADVGFNLDLKGLNSDFIITQDFNKTLLKVKGGGNAVNNLTITAATAGNPVLLGAEGSDSAIDISIAPKGTGLVRFGSWTSNADAAVNGYIQIKDSAGNIRKIPTIA